MSKFASIHTSRKTKLSFKHNYRLEENHPNVHKDLTKNNENNISIEEAQKMIDDLYKQAEENYKNYCINYNGVGNRSKKPIGIQNFTKKENAVKEFIFEIKEDTTMEDCEKLSKAMSDLLNITPIQISIHRDEGHKDKNGNFIIHHHAHASFFTLDSQFGIQMARSGKDYKDNEKKLTKKGKPKRKAPINPTFTDENMSRIQDLAADILKMKRGKSILRGDEVAEYIEDYKEYKKIKQAETNMKVNIQKQVNAITKDLNQKNITLKNKEVELNNKELTIKNKEQALIFKEAATEAKHKLAKEKLEDAEKEEEKYKNKIKLLNEDEAKLNNDKTEFYKEKQEFYNQKQEENAILKKYNVNLENIVNFKERGWKAFVKVFNNDEEKAKEFLDNHTKQVVFQLSKSMSIIIEKAENIINENEKAKNPNYFKDRSLSNDFERRMNDFIIQHTHSKQAKKDLEKNQNKASKSL